MICPNCQGECVFTHDLNIDVALHSCPSKCFQIIRDDKNIYHYELEQKIGEETYYMEVYNLGSKNFSSISSISLGEVVPTYPVTPAPRYTTEILRLNYAWIFQSQEELNNIIQRLLNLKAFT